MSNNLSPHQFPKITMSRNEYGTASVYTEPHRVGDISVDGYHWHNGDSNDNYVETTGRKYKKNGDVGLGAGRLLGTKHIPDNVMETLKAERAKKVN